MSFLCPTWKSLKKFLSSNKTKCLGLLFQTNRLITIVASILVKKVVAVRLLQRYLVKL